MSRRFLTPVNLPSGVTLPSVGSAGDLFFKSDEGKVYVHTGSAWAIQQGPTGPTGPTGPQGDVGPTGSAGSTGAGVAPGGTAGQILAKIDGDDYNTEWVDNAGGGSLDDLTDVTTTSPDVGEILYYNSSISTWENKSLLSLLADYGLITGDGGEYNTSNFTGTIDAGIYNTTDFTGIYDGGNESSF